MAFTVTELIAGNNLREAYRLLAEAAERRESSGNPPPEGGFAPIGLIGNPNLFNPLYGLPVAVADYALDRKVNGRPVWEQTAEEIRARQRDFDGQLRDIDFPGIPPATAPTGSEWQPTIVVSANGREFSQGPSRLVPAGTKSKTNEYYDPDGNRIYPPDGGWAHPTKPNEKVPDPNPNGEQIPLPEINPKTGEKFTDSRDWKPRIDPLTLDLDGDGIETIGLNANNNVLFDHDGDGAKHGTGWVSADDAMLVLDRNNNGTIDNGRELFGDNTQLANGRFAADGFAALAEMDSNGDGKINADDTQFANLRLWRDLSEAANSVTWLVAA